jgi:hypothetical protein
MIENEMMFGPQLPRAGSEAKPKAKAGTPIVWVAIPVAIIGTVVRTIVGPVTVTVAIVGPVIRTIAAVAVPAVSITDILYHARVLSI